MIGSGPSPVNNPWNNKTNGRQPEPIKTLAYPPCSRVSLSLKRLNPVLLPLPPQLYTNFPQRTLRSSQPFGQHVSLLVQLLLRRVQLLLLQQLQALNQSSRVSQSVGPC